MNAPPIGWLGILRLGLVQAGLGAIVVLATSTMNRVMVVELALPALVPGALVALQYFIQVLRPRLGYGSDVGGRRTPWIVGGMAVLVIGGIAAAGATALMGTNRLAGIALAVLAYAFIGIGVGASGTSLLVLLAKRVTPQLRPSAATIVWLMMIAGTAITAGVAGRMLTPFSPSRLVFVTTVVGAVAFVVALLAVWGVEGRGDANVATTRPAASEGQSFGEALAQVWSEPQARRFAIFVFVSMLAYSAQELILEPFAGAVFRLTPGQSTQLAGVLHAGVLVGMLIVAIASFVVPGARGGAMRLWTIAGCCGSACVLLCLATAGYVGTAWPLRETVFVLGVANGAFAVSAIGSMMGLAGVGREAREGVRVGLWGAAQAVAFGLGGLVGTGASDLARSLLGSPITAYSAVFVAEAALFLFAATQAARVFQSQMSRSANDIAGVSAAVTSAG